MLKDKATLLREAAEEAERISKAASADNRIGELADPLQNLADALAAVLTQELAPSET